MSIMYVTTKSFIIILVSKDFKELDIILIKLTHVFVILNYKRVIQVIPMEKVLPKTIMNILKVSANKMYDTTIDKIYLDT